MSTATAPLMASDEMTSGELLTEDQFPKEMRLEERKRARRVAQKSVTTRSQSDRDEKRGAEATRSSTSDVAKVKANGRCALMARLIRGGVLRYANADTVEEARLAWELAGDLIAGRAGEQREEQPLVPEERPSLAAREGPPEVERERQRQELQRYLQRMDTTEVYDGMGQ